MKRTVKKIISIIIIFSILVSTVFVLTSSADEETYSSSADKYFSELKKNIPENVVGSCGYVAMSMLLAYYDTYWNDSFVDAQYDWSVAYTESALINGYSTIRTENNLFLSQYNQYVASGGTLSQDEYYINFVNMYQNAGYLHLDLIGIGIDEGYYDGLIQNDEYAASLYETGLLFDIYFDDIFGDCIYFDPYDLFNSPNAQLPLKIKYLSMDDGYSYDYVFNKMAELVDSGVPVMYRGAKYADGYTGNELFPKKTGHRMIAYDVIKENGDVIDFVMHTGWTETEGEYAYCQNLSDMPYNMDIGILWLEINENMISHTHSDNYLLSGGGTACSCEFYGSLHPEHVHEGNETGSGEDYVNYACVCCWCDEPHSFTSYNNPTSTSHTAVCECGYSTSKAHVFTYESISSLYHISVCACGYTTTGMHTTRAIDNRYSACTLCGEVFDSWSDNTIFKIEEDIPQEQE